MFTTPSPHGAADTAIAAVLGPATDGDPRALQQLINLIHPQVVRYCRARVGHDKYPTADDIAQEVCLAVVKAVPNYEDKGLPFMAFVYRVASNKIVDARRSHARDLANPTDEMPDEEISPENPEADVLMLDACNEVSELLDLLSDKARDIIALRVFGGYSAEEAAEILGITAGAVRVAQFRALAKLRKHLDKGQK